jgi:hypothetical protein
LLSWTTIHLQIFLFDDQVIKLTKLALDHALFQALYKNMNEHFTDSLADSTKRETKFNEHGSLFYHSRIFEISNDHCRTVIHEPTIFDFANALLKRQQLGNFRVVVRNVCGKIET